MLEIRKES